MSHSFVRADRQGALGVLTLTRPSALNALDLDMLRTLREALRAWADDPAVERVALRGEGDRAFCAGGDIKAVWARRGDAAFMDDVYRVEYELDHLIHVYPKPFIALVHGITMGGGCGLALHAAHRVAAEDLVLAMPETAIGLFPDVGACRFLAACPDGIGLYLGLTGARLDARQAVRLGLIDHIVPRRDHDALCERLARGSPVADVLSEVSLTSENDDDIIANRAEIASVFAKAASVQAILDALAARSTDFAVSTLETLRAMSPFSLAVTFESIRRGNRDLADVLRDDFRIAQRLMGQEDYFEGVRAMLIDKDRRPRWTPPRSEDVDPASVTALFDPLPNDLWP